jgi:hypothetical protein
LKYCACQNADNEKQNFSVFFILNEFCVQIREARLISALIFEKEREKILKKQALQNVVAAKSSKSKILTKESQNNNSILDNSFDGISFKLKLDTKRQDRLKFEKSVIRTYENEVAEMRLRLKKPKSFDDQTPDSSSESFHLTKRYADRRNSRKQVSIPDDNFGDLVVSTECSACWRNMYDGKGCNWMLMQIDLNANKLLMVASGQGGMHELIDHVNCLNDRIYVKSDSNIPCASCFRVIGVDGQYRRSKFISVYLNNPKLHLKTRMRLSQFQRHIKSFLAGCHVEISIELSQIMELSEILVIKRLLESGGAHAPSSFEF